MMNAIIFEDSSKVSFGGGQKGTIDLLKCIEEYFHIVVFDTNRNSKFQERIQTYSRKYILSYSQPKNTTKASFSISGAEILVFPFLLVLNFLRILLYLVFQKFHTSNTILYTSSKKNLFFLYLLNLTLGYKFVYHARTLDDKKSIWFMIVRSLLKRAAVVICVSKAVESNFNIENSTVVYNTVQKPYFVKGKGSSQLPFRVGFIGELLLWKGIEVFGQISNCFDDDDLEFHAFGGGKELQALQSKYPRVNFHGFVQKQQQIYNHLDLVLSTSVSPESFGRTTLEAASYGVPCVSSKLGGQIELLKDGAFGILAQPGNVNEFCKHITLLSKDTDLYFKLSQNGINFSQKFFPDVRDEKIIQLFRSLLR